MSGLKILYTATSHWPDNFHFSLRTRYRMEFTEMPRGPCNSPDICAHHAQLSSSIDPVAVADGLSRPNDGPCGCSILVGGAVACICALKPTENRCGCTCLSCRQGFCQECIYGDCASINQTIAKMTQSAESPTRGTLIRAVSEIEALSIDEMMHADAYDPEFVMSPGSVLDLDAFGAMDLDAGLPTVNPDGSIQIPEEWKPANVQPRRRSSRLINLKHICPTCLKEFTHLDLLIGHQKNALKNKDGQCRVKRDCNSDDEPSNHNQVAKRRRH
jgi:hypothetical protein